LTPHGGNFLERHKRMLAPVTAFGLGINVL
jgi:hypothetical protein